MDVRKCDDTLGFLVCSLARTALSARVSSSLLRGNVVSITEGKGGNKSDKNLVDRLQGEGLPVCWQWMGLCLNTCYAVRPILRQVLVLGKNEYNKNTQRGQSVTTHHALAIANLDRSKILIFFGLYRVQFWGNFFWRIKNTCHPFFNTDAKRNLQDLGFLVMNFGIIRNYLIFENSTANMNALLTSVRTWRVTRLYSEIVLSRKPFAIERTHMYGDIPQYWPFFWNILYSLYTDTVVK
jgi:hypothetical protein